MARALTLHPDRPLAAEPVKSDVAADRQREPGRRCVLLCQQRQPGRRDLAAAGGLATALTSALVCRAYRNDDPYFAARAA